MKDNLQDTLNEVSKDFIDYLNEVEVQEEEFWSSLTQEEQLCAFNSVMRRLHKGELQEQGSYRYILYDVFGFDEDAYMRAQSAGFLELHNAFYYGDKK